jgi:hypothetical protein
MKKLLLLLLILPYLAISQSADATPIENILLTNAIKDNLATRVIVQDSITKELKFVLKSTLNTNISIGNKNANTFQLLSSTGSGPVVPQATTTEAGLLNASDKTKINGLANGATANSTDAQLRDRTTHTGVQTISTITNLQSSLDLKENLNNKQNSLTVDGTGAKYTTVDAVNVGLQNKKFVDGSISQPSITFINKLTTGLFRKTNGSLGISIENKDVANFTTLGRLGIGIESPRGKVHVIVDNDVTAGIRSTAKWTGTTASPYVNNDNSLFETENDIQSNSTNYSWSVSADNSQNTIPLGVTDSGFRIGVYGWAASKDTPLGKHDGTLALQIGVRGLAGFLGDGNTSVGNVIEAIGVRGEINNDATSAIINTATAVEALSTSSIGVVQTNFGVRSVALNGTVENWSFHGDAGKLFNQDKGFFGNKFTEVPSALAIRGVGNSLEFGFPDVGFYGSAVGTMPVSGNPFISFGTLVDFGVDKFTTKGKFGSVIYQDNSGGGLLFAQAIAPNATKQTLVERARIDQNGRMQFQQTPIIPAFAPVSKSSSGQTGQISWDGEHFYVCVSTNNWVRSELKSWNAFGNTNSGDMSLKDITLGSKNVADGFGSLSKITIGSDNSAIGANSGQFASNGVTLNTNPTSSLFIGNDTRPLDNNQNNQIVIGSTAKGAGSNSATLGNVNITKTILRGVLTVGTTTEYADNSAAIAAGLTIGQVYRTGDILKIVH